ncbi:MAG: hypothetical protein ACE5EQ_08515 [Phycisphaerae bacterium]
MVGIIQEQHPDRCRLFMQWKNMDWPIVVDSLDLLGVSVVPITLAIDEHGIIRHTRPQPDADWLEANFLSKTYEAPSGQSPPRAARRPDLKNFQRRVEHQAHSVRGVRFDTSRAYADALVMWAPAKRLGEAIKNYRRALARRPDDGPAHFRLGVAYRKRFDSPEHRPSDFQKAVDHWSASLEIDPNHYIRRRRIQQYGPRQMKPYPFYDWVPRAREEIRSRGEEPVPLRIEPGGAEFARPARQFESSNSPRKDPDPKGRITRDEGLIRTEVTVVPPIVKPGQSARVHVVFRPDASRKAHWNNESGASVLWINPPPGSKVDSCLQALPTGRGAVSRESRAVEFEVQCAEDARPGTIRVPMYALYYVCEDAGGKCLYRRRDMTIGLKIGTDTP